MQMAKYKYGKHCHLCACFTKDPIVRSYFRFLKYLTSLLQSFDQLYTFFYCYKLPKFICNSFAHRDGHEHYRNVNVKPVEYTGKKGFPSIFFDWSLRMDDLGVLSLVRRDTANCSPLQQARAYQRALLLQPLSTAVPKCLWMWQKKPPFGFLCCGIFAVQFNESLS